jgi:hypothetical protein
MHLEKGLLIAVTGHGMASDRAGYSNSLMFSLFPWRLIPEPERGLEAECAATAHG